MQYLTWKICTLYDIGWLSEWTVRLLGPCTTMSGKKHMQQLFCLLTRSSLGPTHHPNKCPAKWHSVQCKLEVSSLRDGTLLEIKWCGFHTFFDNIHYYVDFMHDLCLLKLWLKYAYLLGTFVTSCVHMEGVLTTIWGTIHFQWSPHECSLVKKPSWWKI